MARHLLSLLLLTLPTLVCAQVTVPGPAGVVQGSPKGAGIIPVSIDSLTQKINPLPDSLLPAYTKIDSIRNEFNTTADSLQNQYQKTIAGINLQTSRINRTIDSLQHLKLPANRYKRSLKKLSDLKQKTESQFSEKLAALKARTTDKLNALDLPPEYMEPLQGLTKQIDKVNLNSDIIKIPELKIPGYDIPSLNGAGNLPSLEGKLPSTEGLNGINVPQLPNIETPGGIGDISQQLKGYEDKIGEIVPDDITNVEKLPETLESQASKIDGIDEIQKQSGIIDQHKTTLNELADPAKAKEKVAAVAKKAAVDHFAGKEEQLRSAMEKISKYKQKYSSVSSIRDLPRRPPNPMKNKPFIERLVPGLYLQYQQKNSYLADINPYLGYKLTGRFTTGIGWNHRLAWDSKPKTWDRRSRIFGPRAYVDFKLGKGFIAHIEGESMNSFVPSTIHSYPDAGRREWVWGCMTGIKKEYRIYKNLKGTALIQYNLFNRYYKAPYVDRLNSRIGFEYTLKKKKKAQSPNP